MARLGEWEREREWRKDRDRVMSEAAEQQKLNHWRQQRQQQPSDLQMGELETETKPEPKPEPELAAEAEAETGRGTCTCSVDWNRDWHGDWNGGTRNGVLMPLEWANIGRQARWGKGNRRSAKAECTTRCWIYKTLWMKCSVFETEESLFTLNIFLNKFSTHIFYIFYTTICCCVAQCMVNSMDSVARPLKKVARAEAA